MNHVTLIPNCVTTSSFVYRNLLSNYNNESMKTKEGNLDNDTPSTKTFWKRICRNDGLGVEKKKSPSQEHRPIYNELPKLRVRNYSEGIRDKSKHAFVSVGPKY